jgi:O-acetyl-ADP-ribose deacetylase (regulator of RNase III)
MGNSRTYRFGESTLTLLFGDLSSSNAQVLVSSDDYLITMGGGVSESIRRAGGNAIALDAAKKVPTSLGAVVVTTAGSLSAQYVFHAITIGPNPNRLTDAEVIERTTRRCMQLLRELQLTSIAFPAIGAGAAGFGYDQIAVQMSEVIVEELIRRTESVDVSIYLYDRYGSMTELDFIRFFEEFARRAPGVAKHATAEQEPPHPRTLTTLVAETEHEIKGMRINNLRRLLRELEEHRSRLEDELLAAIHGGSTDVIAARRRSLAENQELRLAYMNELHLIGESAQGGKPLGRVTPTVFVSSTYLDLQPHRAAIKDAIVKRKLFFRGMEFFGADPDGLSPGAKIVEEVRNADVYVGVFGVRYGSIDPDTGLSMTELEFREAELCGRKMLLYVMHPEAAVPVSHIESDPEAAKKLAALKEHILKTHVVYQFRSVDDLAGQVYADLEKISTNDAMLA